MDERDEIYSRLELAHVLTGLRWARWSTHSHALTIYDPTAGHDQAFLGQTCFTVLRDRLDRVFQCQDYRPPVDGDASSGLDILQQGLGPHEYDHFPQVPLGTVIRDNLNYSPGWRFENCRWLLSSFPFGKIDQINWLKKSGTKQRVAAAPDPRQGAFVVDAGNELIVPDEIEQALVEQTGETKTYVLAHSLDPDTAGAQLFLGSPQIGRAGRPCWRWRFDVLAGGPSDGVQITDPTVPAPDSDSTESDTPARVRLRKETEGGTPAAGQSS